MSTAQQVSDALCACSFILARAAKWKHGVVSVDTEYLQALVDEVRRLSKDDGEC